MLFFGCTSNNSHEPFVGNKLNKAWLNQFIEKSDSTYQKHYMRRDFVTAYFYTNKKDSTLCQVMRDSAENVRQVIIEKNGIRTFYSQFYTNGQALFIVELNNDGQLEGKARNFYPDGKLKSQGNYYNGLYSGVWEYYDEQGKLVSKEEYGKEGERINIITY